MKNFIKYLLLGTIVVAYIGKSYAEDLGDEFGGPGITMTEADWDGQNGRVYSWGVGPTASYEAEGTVIDLHYQAPVTVDFNITCPVDNSLIDMGPTSASNAAYSLHRINDGGPGTNVESNALGKTMLYDDGGPGMTVTAMSYTDNGPTTVISTANPENYLTMIANGGPTSGEVIYGKKAKTTSK